jgi:hypothetical protein
MFIGARNGTRARESRFASLSCLAVLWFSEHYELVWQCAVLMAKERTESSRAEVEVLGRAVMNDE